MVPKPEKRLFIMLEPMFIGPLNVDVPAVRTDANKFVLEAVVAKTVVEVELDVVELTPVKFCKVEEPVTRRLVVVA